jgi:hypothetical protein
MWFTATGLLATLAPDKNCIVKIVHRSAHTKSHQRWLVLSFIAAALAGCSDDIRVYRIPKEKPQTKFASERPPAQKLEWKLPEGWSEQSPGHMSVASFSVTGSGGQTASITAMPFPGLLNQDLLVINILRETSKLPPITEADLAQHTQQVVIGPATGRLFEMNDDETNDDSAKGQTDPNTLMIAMVTIEGVSWFFRMSGHTPLVMDQKPAFLDFLRTVAFRPPGEDSLDARAAPAIAESAPTPKPAWTVPESWKEVPATTMLLAKFIAGNESGAKAEITVSVFPGSTGGLLANVNRWRGQISLPPVAENELATLTTPLDHTEAEATLVDMTGTDAKTGQKTRLIGAVMPHHGETWFYKLLGDESVAEREKAAFVKFVQTVDYHAGARR